VQKVLIFGTFDGLHPGHENFFEQAVKFGRVFAVVARDVNVFRIKNRRPYFSERSRLATVAHNSKIFSARLGDRENFLKPIQKIQPDLICLGFDQKTFTKKVLQQKLHERNLASKIIRLKSFHPEKYKSSILQK